MQEPPKPVSRAEQRLARDQLPYYPPIPDCCAYLVSYWRELGRVESGGMGPVRLSNREVAAWIDLTGHELDAWEVRVLRGMSAAFIAELSVAEDPGRPAPWQPDDAEFQVAEKAATAKNVRSILRA